MLKQSILITGINGFLGSHIARRLIFDGWQVIGLIRKDSDLSVCHDFFSNASWIIMEGDWKKEVSLFSPDFLIHCAWGGVRSSERSDQVVQDQNIEFLNAMLMLAKECSISRFIGLGSQAEYGILNSVAVETQPLFPCNPYGHAKVKASGMVEEFCTLNRIQWHWLRVFSVYGDGEGPNWLIPFVINGFLSKKDAIELGPCSQQYAYLYVKDFVEYISMLLNKQAVPDGIFNISGSYLRVLKDLVLNLRSFFPGTSTILKFDSLPVREGQSTLLMGSMEKFHSLIGNIVETPLLVGLEETVNYYKSRLDESQSI